MSIAVERQYLSMRVPLLSVAKGNTKAHEMNGLCGYRVCIPTIRMKTVVLMLEISFLHTDIPDQTAIVRQYMRFTGQISSAATVSQSIKRALQMCVLLPC
jgi:hypothetical protein